MKKSPVLFFIVVIILIGITGCVTEKGAEKNNQTTVINFERDKLIRDIAYQSLSDDEKKTIINWEKAEITEYKSIADHQIGTKSGLKNIKGIDTYKVIFETTSDGLLGPIQVYLDKQSNTVLGVELRE